MDGGREGITSMNNIPQQHSGRDHRDMGTQRQRGAEQREQGKKTDENEWILKWIQQLYGVRTKAAMERGREKRTSCTLVTQCVQHCQSVTTGTGWMTSGNFVTRGSTHNYHTVGSVSRSEQICYAQALVTSRPIKSASFHFFSSDVFTVRAQTSPQWICHKTRSQEETDAIMESMQNCNKLIHNTSE